MKTETAHRCRICRCTESNACVGSCSWVKETGATRRRLGGPICSTCEGIRKELEAYIEISGATATAIKRLIDREIFPQRAARAP